MSGSVGDSLTIRIPVFAARSVTKNSSLETPRNVSVFGDSLKWHERDRTVMLRPVKFYARKPMARPNPPARALPPRYNTRNRIDRSCHKRAEFCRQVLAISASLCIRFRE